MGAESTKGPWEADRGFRDAWAQGGHTTVADDFMSIYCGDEATTNFDPEKHNWIAVHGPDQEANAAFIVRDANSHEELVAVGKRILAKLDSEHGTVTQFDADDLRAAIQLATA